MTYKSRVVLAVTLLAIAIVVASEASDPINLSRHVYSISASGSLVSVVPISAATLDPFCRDADGCTISVRVVLGDLMRGNEARVYLAASDSPFPHWSSTVTTAVYFDDNDVGDSGVGANAGSAGCAMSDRDGPIGALDSEPGFSLTLGGPMLMSTATCEMVISD